MEPPFSFPDNERPVIKLIVAADEPAIFFSSVEAAASYLEAIDVEDGIYTAAYGPDGQPYRLRTEAGRVIIEMVVQPRKPEALRTLILRYLSAANIAFEDGDNLMVLLEKCRDNVAA